MTHRAQGTGSWKKNRDKHEGASKPVKTQKKSLNGHYDPNRTANHPHKRG